MRSKEDALDYRYFPEPDLPPLQIDQQLRQRLDQQSITIPHTIIKTMKETYGFNKEYINALISDYATLEYFMELVKEGFDAKICAKRIAGPIAAWLNENFKTIAELPFTPEQFHAFLQIAQQGSLIKNQLKVVMQEMIDTGKNPADITKEK